MKRYYQKVKPHYKELQKEYYLKNKKKINIRNKKYHLRHREHLLEKQREYYKKNKDKWKLTPKRKEEKNKYNKIYRKKNKELILLKNKERYWKNRTKYLIMMSEYKKKNRIKMNDYKKRINVKEKTNIQRKKREKEDQQYNLIHRLRSRLQIALKFYSQIGKIYNSKGYGIDYKAIIEYLKPFPENLQDYDIHHKKELCSFNFINPDSSINFEEIKKAFAPENHQLLLRTEHRKLNNREIENVQ